MNFSFKIYSFYFNKLFNIYILLILLLSQQSCRKLIEVDPPIDRITPVDIYNSNDGAASVLNGIYLDLTFDNQIIAGNSSIGFITGLSADEISLKPINTILELDELYRNNLAPISSAPFTKWSQLYALIFRINSAIEGINRSQRITIKVKTQLIAEAKFLRAFFYFNLVNLFGDVPLILTTDINETSQASRASISKVYSQVIADLKNAEIDLDEKYLSGNLSSIVSQRVRPNKAAAIALLSRILLYTSQWQEAEIESSKLINDDNYQLVPLSEVFKTESKEAIWQLEITSALQTTDGVLYVPTNGLFEKNFYLSDEVFNSFEIGDQRKSEWVTSVTDASGTYNYPYKYKVRELSGSIIEYPTIFRLSEQFLIRAEARAYLGKIDGTNSSKSDLNILRSRAGLQGINADSKDEMLDAILKERKVELFTEFGHRWFDLKRNGQIDTVMGMVAPLKGGNWSAYKSFYPIPASEIQKNKNLIQNPEY
jgi:starch-binding outer membrane protein, SusD/RagB family